jgi:putative Holliday junction resolvase
MSDNIKKYLGIDWGEARIGLALADSESKLATPHKVVPTFEEVLEVVREEQIDMIVVGQPVKMGGEELGLQKEFADFLGDLKNQTRLPISIIDERLTSKAADALPGDKKTKAERDAIAAMLILQSYLDR